MAAFDVHLDSDLSAAEAWRRILDLRAHSEVIPFTTVRGDRLEAADLVPGSSFIARTGVGPLAFDDVMVVDDIDPPTVSSPGRARIRKQGRVIRGTVELAVTQRGASSSIDWRQQIDVRWVPAALDPVLAGVARTAYGRTLVRLLSRA